MLLTLKASHMPNQRHNPSQETRILSRGRVEDSDVERSGMFFVNEHPRPFHMGSPIPLVFYVIYYFTCFLTYLFLEEYDKFHESMLYWLFILQH